MQTLTLKISDQVLEKLIPFLKDFDSEEVSIIYEDLHFAENQKALKQDYQEILQGQATFLEIEEVEKRLENTIQTRENRL